MFDDIVSSYHADSDSVNAERHIQTQRLEFQTIP